MLNPLKSENINLAEISFVKLVPVGHINKPTSVKEMNEQMKFLNKCLEELPKGRIIGKNVSTFMFTYEDLPGRYEQVTYHIGWKRKPYWLEEEEMKNTAESPAAPAEIQSP